MTRARKLLLPAALVTLLVLATGAARHHSGHRHHAKHAAVLVTGAGPVGPKLFGFNDNSVLMGETDPASELERNAAVGANVIRYTVNWDYVEPSKGQLNWHGYDPLYSESLARGVHPILVVLSSPSWTRPADLTCFPHQDHCRTPPDANHNQDFADFMTALANRYPQAAAIEVWNEPNLIQFWQSGPDVTRYAQLVNIAYDAIKQAQPSMPVLAGSINNTEFDGGGSVNFPQYLQQFLALKPHFDALSLHDYEDAGIPSTWFTDTLDTARSELDKAGYGSMPIWLTEMGESTIGDHAVLPAVQGKRLVELLGILGARSYIKAAIIHTMVPAVAPPTSSEYGFAVMNSDGTPKSAYCALAVARKVAIPTGCPHPPPARTLRACSSRQHGTSGCSAPQSQASRLRSRRHPRRHRS